MKEKKIQEINDISDHEYVDTSDMDRDARKVYIMSTIISALLTAVNVWAIACIATVHGTTKMLIACLGASIIVPIVFISIYKMREKSNDYLNIIPCLRFTSRYNWLMTAAPLALVVLDFIIFGFNTNIPGGAYSQLAILAVCYIVCLYVALHASKAYNKEEPLHAMLSTYSNDNTILWWAAFLGLSASVIILILTSEWFNS